MKQFLFKISLIVLICGGTIAIIVLKKNDHFRDINYSKFKSKHNSLILGTSRANFAIDPAVFNEKYDLLNFAFTLATSPYGKVYYDAIKMKTKDESGAIFILDIDPFALSQDKTKPIFGEEKNSLGRQFLINSDPNFEYIIKNETPIYDVLFPVTESNKIKFDNGFTQLKNNYAQEQEDAMRKQKIAEYIKLSQNNALSQNRMLYLEKTIELLKEKGNVYLVSVPVSSAIFSIQEKYWPSKYAYIENLISKYHIQYLNLQHKFPNPKTIDGVHLTLEEAHNVSTFLSSQIDSLEN